MRIIRTVSAFAAVVDAHRSSDPVDRSHDILRPFRSTFRSSAGPAEPGCIICERTCGHRTNRYCTYEAREPRILPVGFN